MKPYVFLIALISLSFPSIAQTFSWTLQNSGTTEKLNDVFFVNDQIGYAVGNNATILHTNNGGTTWTTQTAPSNDHCVSVFFLNADTGWIAVGSTPGSVYRTVNGGQQWSQSILPSGFSGVKDVSFNSASMGWCITYNAMFYSEDGGDTWTQASILSQDDTPRGNEQIASPSDSTCFVASWADNQPTSTATVFHNTSLDFNQFSPNVNADFTPDEELMSVAFINKEIGFVGSNEGRIYTMTSDGVHYSGPWDLNLDLETETSIKSISFSHADHGIFLYNYGTPILSVIGVTNDGGTSWQLQDTISPFSSSAVFLSNPNLAWIVGSDGEIYKGTPYVGHATSLNTLQAQLYPNPVQGDQVYLRIDDADYSNSVVTISNGLGQTVYEATLNESVTPIPSAALSAGYFYVTVLSPQGKKFNSILIQP